MITRIQRTRNWISTAPFFEFNGVAWAGRRAMNYLRVISHDEKDQYSTTDVILSPTIYL